MWNRLTTLTCAFVTSLFVSGCGLCGCDQSDADAVTLAIAQAAAGGPVNSATLEVETHLFAAEEFTLTLDIPNQPALVAKGTFSKSGDTVTFKTSGGTSALILPGEYKLICGERDGQKTITLQRTNPLGQPLTFVCRTKS